MLLYIYANYLATVVDNKVVDFVLEYLDDCPGKKLGIDHTGLMGSSYS